MSCLPVVEVLPVFTDGQACLPAVLPPLPDPGEAPVLPYVPDVTRFDGFWVLDVTTDPIA